MITLMAVEFWVTSHCKGRRGKIYFQVRSSEIHVRQMLLLKGIAGRDGPLVEAAPKPRHTLG